MGAVFFSSQDIQVVKIKMQYSKSAILILLSLYNTESAIKFKENAADYIDVGFNKGRTGTRLAEIAVKFRPGKMFEEEEKYEIENIVLEVKSGEDCWTKVDERPAKRGKDKFMWRVKVVPCKQHLIRIGVLKDDCIEYIEYPAPVGPATAEEIANSHFRPSTPDNVAIARVTDDSVVVSWTPSPCAESYELWYESDMGDDSGNITVSAGFGSVTMRELQTCTDYTVYVTALVGDEFSESGEGEFTTCNAPDADMPENVASAKPLEEKINMCKLQYDECEVIKPLMIENLLDITYSTNETKPEMKSEPEAQTQDNSASTTTSLCWILALVLSSLV